MILTVGNTKGGVGKSTIAINIAIARALAGHDVLLIDGDEQRTALSFSDLRAEKLKPEPVGYTAISLQGSEIRTQAKALAKKYDDIVIDVGGRDTGSLRAALTITDTLLVPVPPRTFDTWSGEDIAELVNEARASFDFRALAFLNKADAQGHDNEESAAALSKVKALKLLPMMVGDRKAFPNAATQGRSVLEHKPKDLKAVEELIALVKAVYIK